MTIPELTRQLEAALAEVSREQLPSALAELERLRAAAWLRLAIPPAPDGASRLLTAEEAAELLGFHRPDGTPDPAPLYRNPRRWPFRVEVSPGRTRYSSKGIEAFIRTRQGR